MRDLADCFVHLDRGEDRLLVIRIRPPHTEKEAAQMGDVIDTIFGWYPLVQLSRIEYYDAPPSGPVVLYDARKDRWRTPSVVEVLAKRRDLLLDLYEETGDGMWRQRGDEYNEILALLVSQRLIPPSSCDSLRFNPGETSE